MLKVIYVITEFSQQLLHFVEVETKVHGLEVKEKNPKTDKIIDF